MPAVPIARYPYSRFETNIPANPKHYWRYRMHLTLEALAGVDGFNRELRKMVGESGRG